MALLADGELEVVQQVRTWIGKESDDRLDWGEALCRVLYL